MNSEFKEINTQRGAVLIVALIMLLLLTLVGLSGMRGTSLQENMASNLRESQVAYQAAEAALQMGLRGAREKFDTCPLYGSIEVEEGEYSDLIGKVTKAPHYKIVVTNDDIDPSPDASKNVEAGSFGYLVRVDAFGYGVAIGADNKPITKTELHATYEIKCFE